MKIQEKYNSFIEGLIPEKLSIQLDCVKTYDDEILRCSTILGLAPTREITLDLSNTYSRSIEINISWGKRKSIVLIFCPLNKSPAEVLNDLKFKISREVNSKYTNKELLEAELATSSRFKIKPKNFGIIEEALKLIK